jgi:hypothetical protein
MTRLIRKEKKYTLFNLTMTCKNLKCIEKKTKYGSLVFFSWSHDPEEIENPCQMQDLEIMILIREKEKNIHLLMMT